MHRIRGQSGKRNEGAVVARGRRCDEERVVSALAQTNRSGGASRAFPCDSRFRIVSLGDVDQFGEAVNSSRIDRDTRGAFNAVKTLAGEFLFVIWQVRRRPSPIGTRRWIIPRIGNRYCQE